jgi:mannose-6-phosphate isomerase
MEHCVPSPFYKILPTRVRRGYRGGKLLDTIRGTLPGEDNEQPEEWIASTVEAVNPGLPAVDNEGLTRVSVAGDGESTTLKKVCEAFPEYMLGKQHLKHKGIELGFLAKLLDSAMRLHIQAHPTAAFAREHLQSRYGKLETYTILKVREGVDPYIYLGFQRAPNKSEWRRIIEEQDMEAMMACFDRIPVREGEVWYVPGGLPHAIGEGILMVEVMEPSDLVVRCEFEREGIVVPPAGRFMQRGLDFCLDIFDYQSRGIEEVRRACRLEPHLVEAHGSWTRRQLVGPRQTDCFEVEEIEVSAEPAVTTSDRIELLLAVDGSAVIESEGARSPLRTYEAAVLPAGLGVLRVEPTTEAAKFLLVRPGLPVSET